VKAAAVYESGAEKKRQLRLSPDEYAVKPATGSDTDIAPKTANAPPNSVQNNFSPDAVVGTPSKRMVATASAS
jgi:hypothetical protein